MEPRIHLIDETWIVCPPDIVSAAVADRRNWQRWWPTLRLSVTRDRGLKGIQWAASGELTGTVEIWLEPLRSGVVLHHFLRLDLAGEADLSRRRTSRIQQEFAWHAKRVFWQLKDDLEAAALEAIHPSTGVRR
ncbi:MAG: hypothetical protein QOE71_573 [Pseudonocardiales bacterium]|nr:hypothetical protein [Pseudonocardiales bacterium]